MKILYLNYDDTANPYAAGGQAYTATELTKRLSKKHEITVVTGSYPGAKNKAAGKVRFVRIGTGRLGYAASLLSYWFLLPIYVLLNQRKYDVVCECFTGPFTTSFVPWVANKPLVAVAHFFDSEMLAAKYKLPLDIFQKRLMGSYKNVIVFTERIGEEVKKLNPNCSVAVIPGGVGREMLRSRVLDGKYALYLGRIDIYNKCLDILLDAWKGIDEKLVIAGSGSAADVDKLKSLIKEYALSSKVNFVGRVKGKRKIDLYRNSKFVLQPSRYETFGYVALETLASGKFLICFDIPGFSWLPRRGVLKIKKVDTKSLRNGVRRTLKSGVYKVVKKENRSFARKFDWDLIAERYEEEYLKIV